MRVLCSVSFTLVCVLSSASSAIAAQDRQADLSRVSGTVIDHRPASDGVYIGSPSLAVLNDGAYVASHDDSAPGQPSTSER